MLKGRKTWQISQKRGRLYGKNNCFSAGRVCRRPTEGIFHRPWRTHHDAHFVNFLNYVSLRGGRSPTWQSPTNFVSLRGPNGAVAIPLKFPCHCEERKRRGNLPIVCTAPSAPVFKRVSEAQSAGVNDSPVGCQSRRPGRPQAAGTAKAVTGGVR